MWCFIGKFAKRKSLKPDLFRRAVVKSSESPRKARSTSPVKPLVKNVRIEVEPIEDQDDSTQRAESSSRMAFEINEEDRPRSSFESEMREDALQAQGGPTEEDIKEALGPLSPASSVEPNEDEWEETIEGAIPCVQDVLSEDDSKRMAEAENNIQHQPNINASRDIERPECEETACGLIRPAKEQSMLTPAVPCHVQNEISMDDKDSEHIRPKPINSPLAKPYFEEAATCQSSIVIEAPLSLREDRPKSSSVDIDEAWEVACHDSMEALGTAKTEMSKAHEEIASQQCEDIRSQADTVQVGMKEDLILSAIVDQADESNAQNKDERTSTDIVTLDDKSDTLLVDSIPRLCPEDFTTSSDSQSPKPVVKLPSSPITRVEDNVSKAPQELQIKREPMLPPARTTRSGARISDDTTLLKDFLSRAQASKLAKDSKIPARGPPQASPRRSPRKILAEVDRNSPSPQKPRDLATRPGTPPGKHRLDAFAFDDVDELTAEPTSCRRSNRTRLPTVSKATLSAPSFIPVRRADGTDPVVLQKSVAQDLAVQTRANTRRNKGQSKPPSVALQTLTAETTEVEANRVHAQRNCKSVGWDEKLVYYQGLQETIEEEGKEEKRPKVRRLRGLGASNGTPAPKRAVDICVPQGTPAPRRRGRAG